MSEEAKMYACSCCGKPTPNYREYSHPMAGIFGEGYTSRLIHNDLGFGYAVCPRCYEAEFREMGESCDL